MPRRARKYIPSFPYHIVQCGNNREACFIEPENYLFYLELWQKLSKRYGVNAWGDDRFRQQIESKYATSKRATTY